MSVNEWNEWMCHDDGEMPERLRFSIKDIVGSYFSTSFSFSVTSIRVIIFILLRFFLLKSSMLIGIKQFVREKIAFIE